MLRARWGRHGGKGGGPARVYSGKITVAAALGIIALGSGCGTAKSPSLRSVVLASINRTVSARTAQVSIQLDLGSMTATGSGTIDMSSNALEVQMVVAGGNRGVLQVPVRFVGDTLYEAPPGLSKLEPGRSWVSLRPSTEEGGSSSPLATSGNPTSFFLLPGQPGAEIISRGPSTVNDAPVSSYSVIFSGNSLRQLAKATGFSVPDQALRSPQLVNLAENLEIDRTGRLAEITQQLFLGEDDVSESLDLSSYGTPTSITAPAPSTVITYQQYLHDIGDTPGLLI